MEDAALLHLSQQQQALLRWQQQLSPGTQRDKGKGKAPPPGFAGSSASKAAAADVASADLANVPPMSAEDAVLAVCGVDAATAAAVYTAAAAGDSSGSATRAAFAAAMAAPAPPPLRVATAAEQAAVEEEVFGTKGRVLNAEAGPRWLVQWCGRVMGVASDDTMATAVCRLLLSGGLHLCWNGGLLAGACLRDAALGCLQCLRPMLQTSEPPTAQGIAPPTHPPTCPLLPAHAARSDDEVAAELFDLMGEAVFEYIGEARWRSCGLL